MVGKALIAGALAVSFLAPAGGSAQETRDQAGTERAQTLEAGIGEAVGLLRRLVRDREEELKLRRLQIAVLALQLRTATIRTLEGRLQTLQDHLSQTKEYIPQLESEMTRMTEMAEKSGVSEAERSQLESNRSQMETLLELARKRVSSEEGQIVDLENQILAARRSADDLEEIVMDGLSDL